MLKKVMITAAVGAAIVGGGTAALAASGSTSSPAATDHQLDGHAKPAAHTKGKHDRGYASVARCTAPGSPRTARPRPTSPTTRSTARSARSRRRRSRSRPLTASPRPTRSPARPRCGCGPPARRRARPARSRRSRPAATSSSSAPARHVTATRRASPASSADRFPPPWRGLERRHPVTGGGAPAFTARPPFRDASPPLATPVVCYRWLRSAIPSRRDAQELAARNSISIPERV